MVQGRVRRGERAAAGRARPGLRVNRVVPPSGGLILFFWRVGSRVGSKATADYQMR